jgi:Flp pilus assembly protein TadD
VTLEPSVAKARAEAALQLRRPAEARAMLEQVLARTPNDAEALLLLARACSDDKDFARAQQLTRSASAAAPDDLEILLGCASVARNSHDLEAAHVWATRALEIAPDSPHALNVMSLIQAQRGQGAEALVYAEEALRYNPTDPDLLVAQGLAFDAAGKQGDAAACYVRALDVAPQHVYALNDLAVVRLQCGDLHRASRLLGRAIALDPRLEILRGNLDVVGALSRQVLLSRLGLGTVAAAGLAYAGVTFAWVLLALSIGWTAFGIVRLPAAARRRLGSGLGWRDVLIGAVIALSLPVATGRVAIARRPPTFLAWIAVYAVSVMGRLYWRRFRAWSRLRELGVGLPPA